MKYLLFILFLFFCAPVFSQEDPAILSDQLTKSLKTDKEKVAAIFGWITNNIAYLTRPDIKKIKNESLEDIEDNIPFKSLTERVAATVLKRKVAVCDGYTRLFASLCGHAGIQTAIVLGYARSNYNKPVSKFGVNHYWNAVFFENKWHLIDVTWASGYLSRNGNQFIQEYDDRYYLAAPEEFIKDHYPDDIRWTLLPENLIPDEFKHSPFKQFSFSKYGITSFSPSGGIINAYVGDTISLKLQTSLSEGRQIASSQIVKTNYFNFTSSWVFLSPESNEEILGRVRQYRYQYAVTSEHTQWLYLVYNNDLVLRYKLNVKTRKI